MATTPDDGGALARLLAGGRHNRLLVFGTPPAGLTLPDTSHFERRAWLLPPDQPATTGQCSADPEHLPFIEALFDRLLVTTPLPADTARTTLRELWRVMAPAALALLVVKARRPWQFSTPGWLEDDLKPLLEAAMFEALEWQVDTLPNRHHLILIAKRDGLRAAPIGRVEDVQVTATA